MSFLTRRYAICASLAICALLVSGAAVYFISKRSTAQSLIAASASGRITTMTKILDSGFSPDITIRSIVGLSGGEPRMERKSPLTEAAENGRVEGVRLLISRGASLEVRDEWGHTALHLAAREGHDNIVKILLDSGANSQALSKQDYTPLMWAVRFGNPESVSLLLAHDPHLTDEQLQLLIKMASKRSQPEQDIILKLLSEQ